MTIQDFVDKGIIVVNNMGEIRRTYERSIVFPNGWVGSIVTDGDGYSVATCDYDGYFDWNVLRPFGKGKEKNNGTIFCKTEDEVCKVLSIIESLKSIR